MYLLLIMLALFLAWLAGERLLLDGARRRVPVRVTVTGTRGKSGTARALGAMLRAGGMRVVVKTTGSEASLELPDGTVEPIARKGIPSIIEQRDVIRRCARMGCDALITEIMSIHPENHRMEGVRILQPQTVLLTNARPDHTEAMGWEPAEVLDTLLASVPSGAHLMLPRSLAPLLEERSDPRPGRVELVTAGAQGAGDRDLYREDLALAGAAARSLGLGEDAVQRGLGTFREDAGGLRAWRLELADGGGPLIAVSAFAANDPDSTRRVLDHVQDRLGEGLPSTGLLALRPDRADRTLQWIRSLGSDPLPGVGAVYALGVQAGIVARRVPGVRVLKGTGPVELTRAASPHGRGGGPRLLFGFGNFKGWGERLADWWREAGDPCEL